MGKITLRKTISIIDEKTVFVSMNTKDEIEHCPYCAAEMIRVQDSADFFGFSSRLIYRLIEADKIHFTETESNQIYVCLASTADTLRKNLKECI